MSGREQWIESAKRARSRHDDRRIADIDPWPIAACVASLALWYVFLRYVLLSWVVGL